MIMNSTPATQINKVKKKVTIQFWIIYLWSAQIKSKLAQIVVLTDIKFLTIPPIPALAWLNLYYASKQFNNLRTVIES